jgi:magnesium transporter
MEEEKKTPEREEEQALPVQELPTDIPDEVRQKLAEDLNEQATEDLKQDVREAEKEEANDEEVKANPEMLTKSRLLKLLVKKQYVKLREVTEEEQRPGRAAGRAGREQPPRGVPSAEKGCCNGSIRLYVR